MAGKNKNKAKKNLIEVCNTHYFNKIYHLSRISYFIYQIYILILFKYFS